MEQTKYVERASCPSCGDERSKLFMNVPDFRVSKDEFDIHECAGCGLMYTKFVPSENEIGAFYKADSYDSHRLDNKSLISRVYRLVRGVNVRKKISWLRRYSNGGVVVDYGCGLGHFVQALNKSGYDAFGFEIDAEVRNLAKNELKLELQALESFLNLQENSVDVLTMWHVLEHVYNLNTDFAEIVSRLKVGGHIMIAVPNYKSFDGTHYGKYWEAFDVPRHLYHFDRTTLVQFVERFGLQHIETIPMKFDSYYVSMRSEKNMSNGSAFRGVWNGLLSNIKGKMHGYSSHVFVFLKS